MSLKRWRELVDRKVEQRRLAMTALAQERKQKEILEYQVEHEQEARSILQAVAEAVQTEAHQRVAQIVTRCLQTVYEGKYEFRIVFEQKRGKTEARFVYLMDSEEVDPTEAGEGGALDITCLALRLAAIMLAQPQPRKLLVLDEPFHWVSRSLAPKLRELLKSLASELGVQFLLVTHDPAMVAGRVHQFV